MKPGSDQWMKAHNCVWDPARGYPRWTYEPTGNAVIRYAYMSDEEWEKAKIEFVQTMEKDKQERPARNEALAQCPVQDSEDE